MSTLNPLGDNVLVRPVAAESVTASGIVIPDTASKEKPMAGEIIALPEAIKDQNPVIAQLKVGMKVWFTKYAPTEIKIEGVEYYILDAKSVLAYTK